MYWGKQLDKCHKLFCPYPQIKQSQTPLTPTKLSSYQNNSQFQLNTNMHNQKQTSSLNQSQNGNLSVYSQQTLLREKRSLKKNVQSFKSTKQSDFHIKSIFYFDAERLPLRPNAGLANKSLKMSESSSKSPNQIRGIINYRCGSPGPITRGQQIDSTMNREGGINELPLNLFTKYRQQCPTPVRPFSFNPNYSTLQCQKNGSFNSPKRYINTTLLQSNQNNQQYNLKNQPSILIKQAHYQSPRVKVQYTSPQTGKHRQSINRSQVFLLNRPCSQFTYTSPPHANFTQNMNSKDTNQLIYNHKNEFISHPKGSTTTPIFLKSPRINQINKINDQEKRKCNKLKTVLQEGSRIQLDNFQSPVKLFNETKQNNGLNSKFCEQKQQDQLFYKAKGKQRTISILQIDGNFAESLQQSRHSISKRDQQSSSSGDQTSRKLKNVSFNPFVKNSSQLSQYQKTQFISGKFISQDSQKCSSKYVIFLNQASSFSQSQKYYNQIQQHYQLQKNMPFQRRPSHFPSIAVKVLQNKIEGNGLITNQSNLISQEVSSSDISHASKRIKTLNLQNDSKNYRASNTSIVQQKTDFKMQKDQNIQNLIQQNPGILNKKQSCGNLKHFYSSNPCLNKSKQFKRTDEKDKQNLNFKDPQLQRMSSAQFKSKNNGFAFKGDRIKTLIARKMTVHSILDEDSWNNGIFNQNNDQFDRSVSTVIGRMQITDEKSKVFQLID